MTRYYFRTPPSRRTSRAFLPLGLLATLMANTATGQSVTRIIDPSAAFPHQVLPSGDAGSVAGALPQTATTSASTASFILTNLQVEGVHSLDQTQIAAFYQPLLSQKVTSQDILAVANKIAALYAQDGFELVSVQIPAQQFIGGKAVIQVLEGHVAAVTIEGNTDDADLSLLKEYASRIVAERPLRKATLERSVLLMNDIPGLKVGSRFEAMPGQPGAVRLYLTILRKTFDWGFQANNLGINSLGNTQATLVGAVNSVFQEGDQTQVSFGFPAEIKRYQYYGLSQREPIGSDGAALVVGAGLLETDPTGDEVKGDANTVNAQLSYPLLRSVHESLVLTGDVDMLNSNSALLGQSLSDERTRSVRLTVAYGLDDAWRGTTLVNGSINQGLDVAGARRGSLAFGGPTYTKLALLISREQALPWDLKLRARMQGQYSPRHLPNSEQLLFGGPYFGQAFNIAYLSGDRGVAAALELAHPFPSSLTPDYLSGSEFFGFVDWGEANNVGTIYQLALTHAASGGAGVRLKLLEKVTVELAGAFVITQPTLYTQTDSPRFIFGLSRLF